MNIALLLVVFAVMWPDLLVDSKAVTNEHVLLNTQSSATLIAAVNHIYRYDESEDIQTALEHLSSGDYSRIERGRATLVAHAKENTAARKRVIAALMKSMDKPNVNIERDLSDYYLWREGSILLGDLKAIEALDLLIAHLDMTNGFHSASMVFQPAILGVRKIGRPAIPKLTDALLNSPKAAVRMAAIYCLTEIGGVSAMNALKQAQNAKNNQCVTRFISSSLSTFSYKDKGHVSFGYGAPQASVEARRDWLTAFECL